VGGEERRNVASAGIEAWEWALIKQLVRQLGSDDPDYLETELLIKFPEIKARQKRALSWKNYLWKALRNHALNLVERTFYPETVPVDPVEAFDPDEVTEVIREITLPEKTANIDHKLALERALADFSPRLRRLWRTLEACHGSQIAAAKRLRRHPNTIAYGVVQIRDIFKRHGLHSPTSHRR
jgi:hypothetical protein